MDEAEFLQFAAGVLNAAPETLSLDAAYGELPEWDSVMHLRLVMETEERYGIRIPLETIPEIKTLRQLYGAVISAR